ncbi:PAS domain S-box protein [Segetibacter sp. 3557_3]|uniref:sensor histidine kinase n=1 Tax=Segetibacter sp. 3557_3 TaxID=2547429 RepID=UPI0010591F1D|nr:PAS domain S-box protein [Segetibacter sp. 3557_3]TDH19943.1 PAS domain S-box protein [Segetibacter sp. 3557_3]
MNNLVNDSESSTRNDTFLQTIMASELNLQQLFLNAPDAIIVINQDSDIIFWNPAAEKLFGWTAEEIVNQPLSKTIIPEQHREAHYQGMKRYLGASQAHPLNKTVEITALNRKGEEFFISLTISSTMLDGRNAFISFIRDIRQQKINELELQKKQALLESSNKQLEQFAHVASHDIKEPVRKIMIFADKLKDELGPNRSPSAELYLSKIINASERLKTMIEGILEYSTATRIESTFELISLNHLLGQVLVDLEVLISEKNAIIHIDFLPDVYGTDLLIHQLFYNLISNSLKFSKVGIQPMIQISYTNASTPEAGTSYTNNSYFEITVQDNGIGFKEEFSESIFKAFRRLNSFNDFEGTGLGLSLCRTIMDRHNGTIRASSEEGFGATFTLLFPKNMA